MTENTNTTELDKKIWPEKHYTISHMILNYVTIVALLIGGVWVVFNVLYVKQEKSIAEFTLRELQQKTNLMPHIRSKVTTNIKTQEQGASIVQVRVELSNLGSEAQRVFLDDGALSVIKIEFKDGLPQYQSERTVGKTRYKGQLRQIQNYLDLGAGETYELSFIFQIEDAGTYLVRFLAVMNSPYLEKYKNKVAMPAGYDYSTGEDQYIIIP